jgi:hypothetical protein
VIYSYNKSQRDALFLKFIFDKELYMFRTDLLSIIRSLNTVYTAIGICHASLQTVNITSMTNTYCYVYIVEAPDDGEYTCLKHEEYFIKINLRNSASRWHLL